jgi:ubiquinone/menaquinone biosynthesis C-methylase UbiE
MGAQGWQSADVVASWTKMSGARNAAFRPATERMFAEAGVGEGSRVLDLGTGTGDTALMLSKRVGPTGSVAAVDASAAMIDAAKAAFAREGAGNVRAAVMPAEALDFADGSFDAVVTRNVLMFVDLPRTLGEIRRVLRPGGRVAAVVWAELARNPFHGLLLEAARTRGGWGEPMPDLARAFALGDPEGYLGAMRAAGLRDVAAHRVASTRDYPSAHVAAQTMREAPVQADVIARLPEAVHEAAWAEVEAGLRAFERGDTCEIPLESLVLVATK